MGWRLLDKPKTHRATKNLAKTFAEMEPAPHDRPLSARRLDVYRKMLQEGAFRPVTWASALCIETGGLHRVNGKHTSLLLLEQEKMPDFYVTIEEYECDTLSDVAQLYATFDSRMQSRTAGDIYLSFAATIPGLAGVSGSVIKLAVVGLAVARLGIDHNQKSQPAERAELLLDYPDFVLWLQEMLAGGPSYNETGSRSKKRAMHLQRSPVVGAMFASWQKSKAAATEFWTAVRDESGTVPTLPDRKLARYLVTTRMNHSQHAAVAPVSGREIYVKCLHSWNAWRRGENTNLNYHADKPIPSVA